MSKSSTRISLRSPRRLIRADTFRLRGIFCFRNRYSIPLSHIGEKCPVGSDCVGCARWSRWLLYASVTLLVFSQCGSYVHLNTERVGWYCNRRSIAHALLQEWPVTGREPKIVVCWGLIFHLFLTKTCSGTTLEETILFHFRYTFLIRQLDIKCKRRCVYPACKWSMLFGLGSEKTS